ncbi:segregation and condensation protein A [Streptomyces tropicalis]|uniref:Segregation and condensation protein A n=1 Tax=Streptomyces tropicalis TaxID=3034234 RepID=A0ABT6A5U7_9ACTN|nr:segregation/condensation protein A [Streptomyces tropicalis]MDF3300019.1 segregation/condensation protein A [Streptomyces tropicalis]
MTPNDPPASGPPAGRRRALGRGPGTSAATAPPAGPAPPSAGPGGRRPAPAVPSHPASPEATAPAPAAADPAPSSASAPETEPRPGVSTRPPHRPAPGPVPAPASPATEPPADGPGEPGEPDTAADPGEPARTGAAAGPAERGGPGERREPGDSHGHDGNDGRGATEGGGDEGSGDESPGGGDDGVFKVRLANFEGPFDLLLQLISKHRLDVTEVALSKVTDEFMAHIRAMGPDWDLDETTEFLVVAATLLDLKAARLLPAAEVEDEADLALLEARDLLFARLLQYRAYKQIAEIFNGRLDEEARRYPRTVGLEPHHAELLPEVVISIGPEGFARLAVKAMQPKPRPQVYVDHIHAPLVSVQEQAGIVVARLRELGEASFRVLVEDTGDTLTVVARFLALLELYREKAVALDQETALGELTVRWTGGEGDAAPRVTDEFDRPPEPAEEAGKAAGPGGDAESEEEKA